MKEVLIAAVALLLGLVLGGIGPRSQIKVFEDKLDDRVSAAQNCRSGVGRDLAAFMGSGVGGGASAQPARDSPPSAATGESEDDAVAVVPEPAAEADTAGGLVVESAPPRDEGSDDEPEEEGRADKIAAARTALELRRTQARAALLEHTDADDEQLQTFDSAVESMNSVLLGMSDELSEMLEAGTEPGRRDAMEFAADALDTLLAAEDAMRASFDADQLEGLPDSAVDPFSYVDPDIVDVLAELEKAE
jgi:hypothetical protein